MLLTMLCVGLIVLITTGAQECENGEGPLYARTFLIYSDQANSQTALPANRTHHQTAYGSCRNLDERAKDMIGFFESFGFDMTLVKSAPFVEHATDEFILTPYRNPSYSTQRIIMGSFYEYAEFMNEAVTFGSWGFVARRDVEGPKGTVPEGTFLLIGVYRWIVDGRVQCVDYQTRLMRNFVQASDRYSPLTMDLYNDEWGTGSMTGLLTRDKEKYFQFRAVISFPGDKM